MDSETKGRLIVATQKHLLGQRMDNPAMSQLDRTILAGKCGQLLARIRQLSIIDKAKLDAIASSLGIMPYELETAILPAIEKYPGMLIQVRRDKEGRVAAVQEFIQTKASILNTTAAIWDAQEPKSVEHLNISGLEFSEGLPRTENEYLEFLHAQGYPEEETQLAYEVQKGFRLIKHQAADYGLTEPIVYSEYMWGDKAAAIFNLIKDLSPLQQEQLIALLDEIKARQGIPIDELKLRGEVYQLAKQVGIIDVTAINTLTGDRREFATTPRLWGTLGVDRLDDTDVFDGVKIFLDSVRYGESYGKPQTGRIADPARLIEALLNRGEIGPATAIGTDYALVEQAGIVTVEKRPDGMFMMRPAKRDVIETALDILNHGRPLPLTSTARLTSVDGLRVPSAFVTAEEIRNIGPAQQSPPIQEAINSLLSKIRS